MKRSHIQFSVPGLAVFSSVLLVVGLVAGTALSSERTEASAAAPSHALAAAHADDFDFEADAPAPEHVPPWGELLVREIEIERPDEYAAFDLKAATPTWVFAGATPDAVRALLEASHLDPRQIERALSPAMLSVEAERSVVHPDDELLLSLSPDSRAFLYHELAKSPGNLHIRNPFRMRPEDAQRWIDAPQYGEDFVATFRKLLYPQGGAVYFSDYEMMLGRLRSEADRMRFTKTLSRQHALLVRLRVRPSTDLDRLLGYWSVDGVRPKDLRPLLESLKRLPAGGTTSLAYALPAFARQRLYTFPMPNAEGANPAADCHWSTLNFFNEVPDDRFYEPGYAVAFVKEHFYRIATATEYGDRIFLIDEQGNGVHSAVYIADDIVFTKNGTGFSQPWVLMHIKDMLAIYGSAQRVEMFVYREKSR